MQKENLKKILQKIPNSPGVYLMKDKEGKVIYIGKSSFLLNRIRSYFSSCLNLKNLILINQVADIEVIPVVSESEALILENRLIKEYQPKYNINLKDGKSYPLVKITKEQFPSIQIVREEKRDNSLYFGPFTNVKLLKKLVLFLRKYYPIRNCKKKIGKTYKKVCTQYYIGRCSGPCEGKISEEEYKKIVDGVISFFEGKYKIFEKKLKGWLKQCIEKWDFEEAQKIKERLFLLHKIEEKFSLRQEENLISYGKENVLYQILKIFKLNKVPNLIEGYDISNIGGSFATGSKVSFKGGLPWKDGYRRYKIKTVKGIDDYNMLKEIMLRRFDSEKEREEIPDLILIDGGKGQLNAVIEIIKKYKLDIPVIAIAKQKEEIYIPNKKDPISLPPNSPILHLFQAIRDEAHRFAIKYHKFLRKESIKK